MSNVIKLEFNKENDDDIFEVSDHEWADREVGVDIITDHALSMMDETFNHFGLELESDDDIYDLRMAIRKYVNKKFDA